ncbi:MAG: hypothetical protein K0Q59_5344, partial [Paenibacillus sp.]|nr:hypothetical protein [Paenibacillus sp.]
GETRIKPHRRLIALLRAFAEKTEQTRSHLMARIAGEETAVIFQLTASRFLVYGARAISVIRYTARLAISRRGWSGA